MDDTTSSGINHFEFLVHYLLVKSVPNHVNSTNYQNILGSYSSDEATKSHKDRSNCVRTSNQENDVDRYQEVMEAMADYSFPKRTQEDIKLSDERIDEESPSNCTPSVASDESHEEAKAH